jgi:hypothetical protein
MVIETNTDVEAIGSVSDGQGNGVAPAGRDQQERQTAALENASDGFSTTVDPSTGGESLSSFTVAEGGSVVLYGLPGNSAAIDVGFDGSADLPVRPGASAEFGISDTSALYVAANTAGDTLVVIGEADS